MGECHLGLMRSRRGLAPVARALLVALVPFAVVVLGSGCRSSAYLADRWRDGADVVTLGVGVGLGAKARVGPVQSGLLLDIPVTGVRGGGRTRENGGNTIPVPDTVDGQWVAFGQEEFDMAPLPGARGKAFRAKNVRLLGVPVPFVHRAEPVIRVPGRVAPAYYYSQVEVVVACVLSIRAGLNPGELADFLTGWLSADLYGDDVAVAKPTPPRRAAPDPPPADTGQPVAAAPDRGAARHDSARFATAYDLIQSGQFGAALPLLEENIAATPHAGNIDYDIAWAMYCCARLGRLEQAAAYYEEVRRNHDGWLRSGADGANRHWGLMLERVREIVAESTRPEACRVLEQLGEVDRRFDPVGYGSVEPPSE